MPLAHGSPGATLTLFPRPACRGGGGNLSFIGIVPPERGSPGIGRVPAGFLSRRLAFWLSPRLPHRCLRPGTVLLGERGQRDGVSHPHACPRWVAPAGLGAGGRCGEDALWSVPCPVCQHSAPLLGTKSLALTGVAPWPGEFGCPINTRVGGEGRCDVCSAGGTPGLAQEGHLVSSPEMILLWMHPITYPLRCHGGSLAMAAGGLWGFCSLP